MKYLLRRTVWWSYGLVMALAALPGYAADIKITERRSPAILFKAYNAQGGAGFRRDWDEACALAMPGCYISGNTEICYANPRGGKKDGSLGCYFDVTRTTPNLPPVTSYDVFHQNWITPYSACPAGWTYISSIGACTRDFAYQENAVCPTSNPVFPSDGSKKLVEVDFTFGAGGNAFPFKRVFSSFSLMDFREYFGRGWMLEPWGRYLDLRTAGNSAGRVMSARDSHTVLALEKDAGGIRRTTPYNGIDLTYDGNGWILVDTVLGLVERYDESGRLVKLAYSDGRSFNLEYGSGVSTNLSAVLPELGARVDLSYDQSNRLASVALGGSHQVSYNYSAEYPGVLASVAFDGGGIREYLYETEYSPLLILPSEEEIVSGLTVLSPASPSAVVGPTPRLEASQLLTGAFNRAPVTGIIAEDSSRFSTYRYDSQGRVLESARADAAEVRYFEYSTPLSITWVQDGLGQSSEHTFVNVRGRLLLKSKSRPAGSGCEASTSQLDYDTRGNVTTRVDFNGSRTCHAYETGRNFESVRLEGLTEAQACPADLAAHQVPAGVAQRKITTTWHPLWKLETRRAEPKKITTTVYNDQDDPLTPEAVKVSCVPSDTPTLPDGSKIAVVCLRYEQSTNDETGNQGLLATPTGTRKWSYEYNKYGQLTKETDPRLKQTVYEYYDTTVFNGDGAERTMGDLKLVRNALGQTTQYLDYNKRGQVRKIQHPNGSVEQRQYHVRGWLTHVTLTPAAGGVAEVTQYEYYPTGLLQKVTQPDGSYTSYTWDAAHRLTGVSDTLGNSVTYELDNAGNRKSEQFKDPSGQLKKTITRTFDALGRMDSSTGLLH